MSSRIRILGTSAAAVSLIAMTVIGFSSTSSASTTNLSAKQKAEINTGVIAKALIKEYPVISETFIAHDLETTGNNWDCFGQVFASFVSSSTANAQFLASASESVYIQSASWSQAVIGIISQVFVDALDAANPYETFTTADVVKVAEYSAGEISQKALGSVGQDLANNLAQSFAVNALTSHFGAALMRASIAAGQNQYSTLTIDFVAPMESDPAPGVSSQEYSAITACNLPGNGYGG